MIELQQVLASIAAFIAVLIVGLLIDRRDRAIAPARDDGGTVVSTSMITTRCASPPSAV